MAGPHCIGSQLWGSPGAPSPLSSSKFLSGVWQPTGTSRHSMESKIWTLVCWLLVGESLEANIQYRSGQQEGFALELSNTHSPRKNSGATMLIPLLPKWQERQLPYHAMAATNHMRGGGEADLTSQQAWIAVRGHTFRMQLSVFQPKTLHVSTLVTPQPWRGEGNQPFIVWESPASSYFLNMPCHLLHLSHILGVSFWLPVAYCGWPAPCLWWLSRLQ